VVFDDHMRTLVHTGAGEQEMTRHARSAGPSIRDDGRRKILEGVTSLEEVLRVTREDEAPTTAAQRRELSTPSTTQHQQRRSDNRAPH